MLNNSSTRLNKYISESGICSRREADRFIEQGNVFINGKRAAIGAQVFAGDKVKVNGQSIEAQEEEDLIFIALNKPAGIVSTTEGSERDNIVDFVNHSTRIFPIGKRRASWNTHTLPSRRYRPITGPHRRLCSGLLCYFLRWRLDETMALVLPCERPQFHSLRTWCRRIGRRLPQTI